MAENREEVVVRMRGVAFNSKEALHDEFATVTGAPDWYGRNLDALNDSLRGGICEITPTKIIIVDAKKKKLLGKGESGQLFKHLSDICNDNDVELVIE
mmetsp:Transcript_11944/g.32318  ORF Transcript_11944/g.32318 Transcript_11944/m.32318 type:complete len:98 (+) Transcript_11944:1242-1535(+)